MSNRCRLLLGLIPSTEPGDLQRGHGQRLPHRAERSTPILSIALQKTIANFDNLRLRVVDGTPTFGEPGAVTDPATDITPTSATLNGRVNARGLPTTFVYGKNETGTLPNNLPATGPPFDGGTQTEFISRPRAITGLSPCTIYFFEIEATNSAGTTTGSRRSFSTACKPDVKTLVVSGVGPDSATFNTRKGLETTGHRPPGSPPAPPPQARSSASPRAATPWRPTAIRSAG